MVEKKQIEKQYEDLMAEKVKSIEEGKYEGIIIDIQRDLSNYDYTRYVVKVEKLGLDMNVSFPTRITYSDDEKRTCSSEHAKFLDRMGIKLDVGESAKRITELLSKKVSFLVANKKTERGTFAEIVKDSIKLAK